MVAALSHSVLTKYHQAAKNDTKIIHLLMEINTLKSERSPLDGDMDVAVTNVQSLDRFLFLYRLGRVRPVSTVVLKDRHLVRKHILRFSVKFVRVEAEVFSLLRLGRSGSG